MADPTIIKIQCQHCRKPLRTSAELIGRRIRCAHCDQPTAVSQPENQPVAENANAVSERPKRRPERRVEQFETACPNCGRRRAMERPAPGKKIRCGKCETVYAPNPSPRRRSRRREEEYEDYRELPPLSNNSAVVWIVAGSALALFLVAGLVVWLVLGSASDEPNHRPQFKQPVAVNVPPLPDALPDEPGADGGAIEKPPQLINPGDLPKPPPLVKKAPDQRFHDLADGMTTTDIEAILRKLGYSVPAFGVSMNSRAVNGDFTYNRFTRTCKKPGDNISIRYQITNFRYRDGRKSRYFTLSTKNGMESESIWLKIAGAINPKCETVYGQTLNDYHKASQKTVGNFGKLRITIEPKQIEFFCYMPGNKMANPIGAKKNPNAAPPPGAKKEPNIAKPPAPPGNRTADLILGEWVSPKKVRDPQSGKNVTPGFHFQKNGRLGITIAGKEIPLIVATYRIVGDKRLEMTISYQGAKQPGKTVGATIVSVTDRVLVIRSDEDNKESRLVRRGN